MSAFIRFGAAAAFTGGALRIAAAFIAYTPNAAWLEALYAAIDLCLLFGLIALYFDVNKVIGPAGLVGFVLAISGIASIVGPDAQAFGIDFYRAGAALFLAGLAVLALSLLRAQRHRIAALAWCASFALGLVSAILQSELAFAAAGVALGAGYVSVAFVLWPSASDHAAEARL